MQFLLDMPHFSIQFDNKNVIAYRSSKFSVGDFEKAAQVIEGVLDRLPDYLKR